MIKVWVCCILWGAWFILLYAMWLPWSELVGCTFGVLWNWGIVVLSCPGLTYLGVTIGLLGKAFVVLSGSKLSISDVTMVWCSLCITCFMVSSIMSPWSVSSSELDWADVGEFVSRVIWQVVGRRLLVTVAGPSVMLCS